MTRGVTKRREIYKAYYVTRPSDRQPQELCRAVGLRLEKVAQGPHGRNTIYEIYFRTLYLI
jgi:hypothetical protein